MLVFIFSELARVDHRVPRYGIKIHCVRVFLRLLQIAQSSKNIFDASRDLYREHFDGATPDTGEIFPRMPKVSSRFHAPRSCCGHAMIITSKSVDFGLDL